MFSWLTDRLRAWLVPDPAPAEPHSPLARVAAVVYAVLVAYASLVPFSGWNATGVPWFAWLTAPVPRYLTTFDLVANFLGYLPLGGLLLLGFRRGGAGARSWFGVAVAVLGGALLSLVLETVQNWLPSRVPSNLDWLTNTVGAAAGALLARAFASALLERGLLRHCRIAWFDREASWLLVVMLLWPAAQIFPQQWLFATGGWIQDWLRDTPAAQAALKVLFPGLAQWRESLLVNNAALSQQIVSEVLVTASAWLAAGLTLTVATHSWAPRLRLLLGWLIAALAVKAIVATLSAAPVDAPSWLGAGAFAGLLCATVLLVPLQYLPRLPRMLIALSALCASIVLTNYLPPNPYYLEWLSAWQHGPYRHFGRLAQWLAGIWPFLAIYALLDYSEQRRLHRLQSLRHEAEINAKAIEQARGSDGAPDL